MDASNAPVRRPRSELHTEDIGHEPLAPVASAEDLADLVVIAGEDVLAKAEYAEALAFAEEPVTIRVERSAEKFAPHVIDCWCNGKGAEVFMNGRWVETKAIPVGMPVTTKRKYVEILARSVVHTINTNVTQEKDSERNEVDRYPSSKAPFSVLKDDNPKGQAWLTNLVRFA